MLHSPLLCREMYVVKNVLDRLLVDSGDMENVPFIRFVEMAYNRAYGEA